MRFRWTGLGDQIDRLEVVWSAIAEALYASEAAPTKRALFRAGVQAMSRYDNDEVHHHGMATHGERSSGFGSAPSFWVYWCPTTSPSPEDGVVDRVALAQIWPRLSADQRRVLLALAAFDDYAAAANALGLTYYAFCARVREARLRFLALWHEGESPSRIWGRDRRIGSRNVGPPSRPRRPVTLRVRFAPKRRQIERQRPEGGRVR